MNLTQILSQTQQLNHLQKQSLQILALDNQELFEYCIDRQTENPTLELGEEIVEQFQTATILKNPNPSYATDEDTPERELFTTEKLTLTQHLTLQLGKLPEEKSAICGFLIESLSDNGYLEISPLEISYLLKKPIPLIQNCINILQSLDPSGIGATSFPHCLLLQLERKNQLTPPLEEVIKYHLEDLAKGYLKKIATQVEISPEEVKGYLDLIRGLNPRPGNGFATGAIQYVVPDLIFEEEEGIVSVRLNDRWVRSVSLSPLYSSIEHYRGDPEAVAYLREKLATAKTLISAIQKRHDTLLAIGEYLLQHQKEAIFFGKTPKPLTMKTLAQQLNLSPSTITRGISHKYFQSPIGSYPLRTLFVLGEESSLQPEGEGIKEVLRRLVEEETTPYNDEELAEQLVQMGFQIKRRTVAKYREELHIPTAKVRKAVKG